MRFPRTIRLDASDTRVYDPAAEPGEWAVSGAFVFADAEPESLTGKAKQAFANGFLGTRSFGWSTLVTVSDIDAAEYEAVVRALAAHLVADHGAPDLATALAAAQAEAAFASSLCEQQINTLIGVARSFGEQGIVERFRKVEPPRHPVHTKIWEIVADGGA